MSHSKLSVPSLGEIMRHREVGEVVNSHVLEHAQEPKPDFAKMERTVRTFERAQEISDRVKPRQAIPEKD